jgi:hypothetical protein|tara:strand:+ start:26827 stop:27432 length:606 start_codon:yes stop_codon:yes gene_type:complete
MKINVKKDGQNKSYTIIDSWEDVTLEKWAELNSKNKESKGKAAEAIANITTLSTLPKDLLKELTLNDVAALMNKLADIQSRANSKLKNKIEVEGKIYGFHPNLESITIGEYADIELCIDDGIENNLPAIMAILYRPITEQKENWYDIEPYDADSKKVREQIFKQMPAETVESALVFFWSFVSVLLSLLPQYLVLKFRRATS